MGKVCKVGHLEYILKNEGTCRKCPNWKNCPTWKRRIRKLQAQKAAKTVIILILAILVVALGLLLGMLFKTVTSHIFAPQPHVIWPEANFKPAVEQVSQTREFETQEEQETWEMIEELMPIPSLSPEGPSGGYYYRLNADDMMWIAKLVYVEAADLTFEEKVAVASVVLNRYYYEDERFNRESVKSVVIQQGQFKSVMNVTQDNVNSVPECMKAVQAACKGWDPTRKEFPKGAKFFFFDTFIDGNEVTKLQGTHIFTIGRLHFSEDPIEY